MRSALLLIGFCFIAASCTTTRWVVTDQFALDENVSPEVLESRKVLVKEREPTINNPVLGFSAYNVIEKEYPLRVRMERSVQKYRPRWGFLLLGIAGSAFALTAANSGTLLPDISGSQRLILNLTGGVLGALSFVNLQPSGEPIFTGESELIRKSGVEVVVDSVAITESEEELLENITITFQNEVLFNENEVRLSENGLEINLASLSSELSEKINDESEIEVLIKYSGLEYRENIPTDRFLAPFLSITNPVAVLYSEPNEATTNALTEMGEGSMLQILDEMDEWLRIRYGNSEAFVLKSSGKKEWRALDNGGSGLIYEYAELPFGEIDVENSVPVLKPRNPYDRALVLTNGTGNQIGTRQYLARDHELFLHYSRTALQIDSAALTTIRERGGGELREINEQISGMNNRGSLHVYLSGFARVKETEDSRNVVLIYEDRDGNIIETELTRLFRNLATINPETLFLYVDLDYLPMNYSNGSERALTSLLNDSASELLRIQPNASIIFSNRPGQSSGLYTGIIEGNMRHHIFTYFWAQAIQQRKTRIADIVNHLRNNMDYMSRRLHDMPQEVQAYGNLTLQITE